MVGFVDAAEQAFLNHIFTDPAYVLPATMYIGLSSTAPLEDGTGATEPSGGGYARVATTAADWGPAGGSAPATKSNTALITFPTATADWASRADLTHFGVWDAPTGGTMHAFGLLGTPRPVLSGGTASFAAGALVLKMGDPTDNYT